MAPGLSTLIPQDVFNEIIDHLQDDTKTLKVCSLASHTMYEPTRKHLFATITLDQLNVGERIFQLFAQNPGLLAYVCTLKIPRLSEDTIRTIVPLLPALSQTRHLVLGIRNTARDVHTPTPGALSLLSVVLRLPLIDTLEILAIRGFPTSHLHIAQGLKSLAIENVTITKEDADEAKLCPLQQLRSLYLHRVRSSGPVPDFSPILDAPSLRRIVISLPSNATQPIIQAGSDSIETVIWDQCIYGYHYPMVNLGVLRKLCRLCFILHMSEADDPSPRTEWDPISDILHSSAVAQTLEELAFVVKQQWNDPLVVPILRCVGQGDLWTDLADTQQFPRLEKVVVRLANDGCEPPTLGEDAFRAAVEEKVPLLVEAGLLHTVVHKRFDWRDCIAT